MPVVKATSLSKSFTNDNGERVSVFDNLSLTIAQGEVLGLVGESGCGKSTLGRTLLRLLEADQGSIEFQGTDITKLSQRELKPIRCKMQIIFQDPFGALNPRHKIESIIEEPLVIHKRGDQQQRQQRVRELLDLVGLPASVSKRYPHQFSGGQRQRIAIARALALNPSFIVADEAVSALDVSIQSQILNLLMALRTELKLSLLFISHDLSVVRHISDRIAVMYFGNIVELDNAEDIMNSPHHPYTQALISAIPDLSESGAERIRLPGELPNPAAPPSGCALYSRCPRIDPGIRPTCHSVKPTLTERASQTQQPEHQQSEHQRPKQGNRLIACHLYRDVSES